MKKFYQTLNAICGNPYFLLIFLPIAVCFLLLNSITTSPLFVNDGMDSAVFKTMGLAILQGKVPYVDIFDHKGPVLYFINALGQWLIAGRMGIFLLQTIGLTIALIFQYRTARLFTNNLLALLCPLVALYLFGSIIEEGNQCEEWMMYVFSVAIYFAANYFVKRSDEPHPWHYGLIYGICFGLTFFIRPNDAVAQMGGIMTGVCLYLLYRKQYRNMFINIATFMAGFAIVALPILLYFAYHHAVSDLYYGLIGFNQEYSGGVLAMMTAIIRPAKLVVLLLFFALCVGLYNSQHQRVLWFMLPLLSFALLLLGNNLFGHYYIVYVPIFSIFLAVAFSVRNRSVMILMLAIFCLSKTYSNTQPLKSARKTLTARVKMIRSGQQDYRQYYEETDKLYAAIPEDERTDIWNYNLRWTEHSAFSTFWHNQLVQCNLITYGSSELLRQKDDIAKAQPRWVMVDYDEDVAKDSVLNALYEPYLQTDTTICKLELWHIRR